MESLLSTAGIHLCPDQALGINQNVYTLATRKNRLSSRRERNSGNSNCNGPHVLWYLRADIWIFHYHVRLPIIIPKALGETLHPHNIVKINIICVIDHAPKLSSNVERKFVFCHDSLASEIGLYSLF